MINFHVKCMEWIAKLLSRTEFLIFGWFCVGSQSSTSHILQSIYNSHCTIKHTSSRAYQHIHTHTSTPAIVAISTPVPLSVGDLEEANLPFDLSGLLAGGDDAWSVRTLVVSVGVFVDVCVSPTAIGWDLFLFGQGSLHMTTPALVCKVTLAPSLWPIELNRPAWCAVV